MLFANNGSDDDAPGAGAGWDQWLRPATGEPAPTEPQPGPAPQAAASGSAWSQWLDEPDPAPETSTGTEGASTDGTEPAAVTPADAGRRRGRRALLVAGGGMVLAVGAVIAGAFTLASTRTPAPALPRITTPAAASAVPDPVLGGGPGCAPARTPDLVRGNGLGGTDNGPDAILAFQRAYYITRSGAAAWAVVAPGAQVSPVAGIDAGIATVPPGTRYCLTITPAGDGAFLVVIAETRPDSTVRTYEQQVTVAAQGGRMLITRIGHVQ